DGDDEPSDDDDDTDDENGEPSEDEDDDDEEEEHLALANSSAILVADHVPLAGDTEAFETDESAPTPRSPQTRVPFSQTCLRRARKTVRLEPPISASMDARIVEHVAAPTPPLHPLPPVDAPTTESPGYVVESDPAEDLEEYEDDETEDGLVDYLMDGGNDGDDDDGNSSGDDADDEDEDEEEEEHLASVDFAVVIPTVKLVSPPERIELVIPPPSTDTTTTGARINVRLQVAISLPSEAEVERLLAMPAPLPSLLTSLSPPSASEHLARCTALSAHSSPPPIPSPLLPSSGCPTQIQTLRMASTLALIDAVTIALPSHPLLPPLYIPPPVDCRDDIPETEIPPRKRSCLFTLGSRYKIGEISTARPTKGRGIDYGFVSTLDADVRRRGIGEVGYGIRDTWIDPAEAVPEIAPMTLGEVNTWVTELAELHEHDTQDLYDILEDAQDSRTRISQRVTVDLQRASGIDGRDSLSDGRHETRDGRIMAPVTRQRLNIPPNNTNPNNMTPESFQAMIDQALLQNSTNKDGSHSSHENNRRNVQTACIYFYANFMKCQPLNFKGTEGVGEIKKIGTKLWNLKVKGNDVPTYTVRFQELTLICTKFDANETKKIDKYISGLPDNINGNVKSSKPKMLDETIELANNFMD
nr:reverse transcriptase domain-containing protein [Tanacetum cinerariifolium]